MFIGKYCQTALQRDCNTLYSPQWCVWDPVSPYFHQWLCYQTRHVILWNASKFPLSSCLLLQVFFPSFSFLVTFGFLPASLCENSYTFSTLILLIPFPHFTNNFIFSAHKVPLKFLYSSSWFSEKKKKEKKKQTILLSQPAGHPEPRKNVNRETQKSLTRVKISEGINASWHNSEGKNIKKNSALFPW